MDSVTITKIIPNRGKCKIGGVLDNRDIKINKTLKYGEVWNYIPLRGCDKLLEVRVETDQGEWDFKF